MPDRAPGISETVMINHNGRLDNISGGYVLDDETYVKGIQNAKRDDFTLGVDNFIPGIEGYSAMPGTVSKALAETTIKLFEAVL